MSIVHLTQETFEAEVMNSTQPVLVDFFATWCGPCKMLSPIMEEIAAERPDVKVCKIDVDAEPQLAAAFRVMSVPTLAVVRNGQVVHLSAGARPKAAVLALLDS